MPRPKKPHPPRNARSVFLPSPDYLHLAMTLISQPIAPPRYKRRLNWRMRNSAKATPRKMVMVDGDPLIKTPREELNRFKKQTEQKAKEKPLERAAHCSCIAHLESFFGLLLWPARECRRWSAWRDHALRGLKLKKIQATLIFR